MTQILCPIVGLNFADRYGFDGLWILLGILMAISFILNVFSMRYSRVQ
ncbi:MAG: hypothetical protein ACI9RU_002197 [Litorivivens sp.]|jgi:hypothetical protein